MADVDEKKVEEQDQPEKEAEEKPQEEASSASESGTDQYGRQLYTVTCSSCGNETQVPFKPAEGRPVYCRDCYMEQRKDKRGGGGGMRRNSGPRR
jgi:CxxC-x17-CxxC domain-containing protein